MTSGSSYSTSCSGHVAWLTRDGEASCSSPKADEGPDDDEGSAYNDEADGYADFFPEFLFIRAAGGSRVALHQMNGRSGEDGIVFGDEEKSKVSTRLAFEPGTCHVDVHGAIGVGGFEPL